MTGPEPHADEAARRAPSLRPAKRSFTIAGHRTSISLEGAFWMALRETAAERQLSVAALVAEIDRGRGATNLSSAIRVWLFERARSVPGESIAAVTSAPTASS